MKPYVRTTVRAVPSKYLTVSDVATLVHHRGGTTLPGAPPETTIGRTVLLLHDAGGNGNGFADLMDELATTHSPVSFDLPGHGRSGGLDALESIEAMAAHTAGLLTQFGLDHLVAVGEGMGGAVAIELARTTELVDGLVLLGGAAASFDVAADIESLSQITSGRARREFDRIGYAPTTEREIYQKAFGEWVKTDPRATLGDRKAQAAWSLDEGDNSVPTPTLVLSGEHEESDATGLASRLADGTDRSIAGAGRRAVIEQPAAVAAAINDFIAERLEGQK